jgi:tellurite resistance protein TehA-like permease
LPSKLRLAVENLFPGYFALVMATGIVSLAAQTQSYTTLAQILFGLNIVCYLVLVALFLARCAVARPRVFKDLTNPAISPAFLTLVAGSCVLGTQFHVLQDNAPIACVLWLIGCALWLVFIYFFFTSLTIRQQKPGLQGEVSGVWLLIVVSTQSLAVLGILLAPWFAHEHDAVAFLALCFYLLGCLFYLFVISLILYRFLFLPMEPAELNPAYWINMGAIAITTMAGARLLQARDISFLQDLHPFLQGFTLFFWAACCWWIPLLVILGIWRHGIRRVPLTYHPSYWAMVFPLGMFAAATYQLAQALHLEFILPIPKAFFPLAFLVWLIVFVGMASHLIRSYFLPTRAEETFGKRK